MTVRVVSKLPQAIATARALVDVMMAKIAHDIEAWAKLRVPIDTGFLAGSIKAKSMGRGVWVIEAAAEYAAYVELGTVRTPAQPYLLPALENVAAALGSGGAAKVDLSGPPSP